MILSHYEMLYLWLIGIEEIQRLAALAEFGNGQTHVRVGASENSMRFSLIRAVFA